MGLPEVALKQCPGKRMVGSGQRVGDPEVEPALDECKIAELLTDD
jgi:hypothetical protein